MKKYSLLFLIGMLCCTAYLQAQNKMPLTIGFVSGNEFQIASTKPYDGTTKVDVLKTYYTVGKQGSDDVGILVAGNTEDKNVGVNKKVIITYTLTGDDADQYYVASEPPTNLTTTITKAKTEFKAATLKASKEYNGQTDAPIDKEAYIITANNNEDVKIITKATLAGKNAGQQAVKEVIYEITGADKDNYDIVTKNPVENVVTIQPKLLELPPKVDMTPTKFYDGTNNVNMVEYTVDGIIPGDDITIEAEAFYDNADAGVNKDVTFRLTITGEDADNYQLSSTVKTYYGLGIICEHITGDVIPDKDSYCQQDIVTITTKNMKGDPRDYFDNIAKKWNTYNEGTPIKFEIPNDEKGGEYKLPLRFMNEYDLEDTLKVDVTINKLRTVTKIFDDVISVINTDNSFTGANIQWYHNGEKIPGANKLYYCEEGGKLTGYYYYVLNDGTTLRERSCNFFVDEDEDPLRPTPKRIIVYPNPVENRVNVNLESFDEGTKHTGQIYNLMGNSVMTVTLPQTNNTIDLSPLPKGVYTLYVEGVYTKLLKR